MLFKYKTILITGGSGFIGLHISQYLKKDYDITVYDIKNPGDNDIEFILGDSEVMSYGFGFFCWLRWR